MQQLVSFWSNLGLRKQFTIIAATLAMFLAVTALTRIAASPGMGLLYAGLDPSASGEVIRALDQRGAIFEVRGDSIWVESRSRDQLRMALAADGLPAVGGAGYELLDGLSGFGTTSQMFDAAYLRAKEGELARTLASAPHIRSARVHIAQPPSQPFRRGTSTTASVSVSTASGGMNAAQARAIRHMVAASVPGLDPTQVAVIDSVAGLLPVDDSVTHAGGEDRIDEMRHNLERLLAARVGNGRALVELSIDLVNEQESIRERKFVPQSRVAISTETQENSANSTGSGAGVTVASNLPEGDAAQGDQSQSQSSETRERVNYEVSETNREVRRDPGGIKRLTVAVLVDGLRNQDGSFVPRSQEELNDLRELVSSAIGYDEARGDVITIKSMELQTPEALVGTDPAGLMSMLDPMTLIQLAVLAIVSLALGLFVIRPIFLSGKARPPEAPLNLVSQAGGTGALLGGPATVEVLNGEIDESAFGAALPYQPQEAVTQQPEADPVERLRQLIAERQSESVEILRSWIEEPEESR